MRWSEQDLDAYLRRGQPPVLTERAWQGAVVRLLKQHGYAYVYHTFDSRRSPSGFPDILAVHETAGHPCYALELKTDTGHVTLAQHAWLDALQGATHIEAEVLRPAGLEAFLARLRG